MQSSFLAPTGQPSVLPRSGGIGARLARLFGITTIPVVIGIATSFTAQAQSFLDIGAALTPVHHGAATWGDYDGDDDLDVLLTGQTNTLVPHADVYNNAAGIFTATTAGLPAITGGNGKSASAWGDFDNDNDLDLFITGLHSGSTISRLYQNTGTGFVQKTIVPVATPGLAFSSVEWGDYDNDGDLDLYLQGYSQGAPLISSRIYRNDGPSGTNWQFTDINAVMERRMGGDAAWGDYDKDGDLDLITTGYYDILATPKTRLYRNDNGVFLNSGIAFADVGRSSVAWGDFDNDADLDLALIGETAGGSRLFRIYRNNLNGTFTQTASMNGYSDGSVACGDYNNDGDLDLVVTGYDIFTTPSANAYTGNGNCTFTVDATSGLNTGVYESEASFGDYNNDGRLDIFLAGRPAGSGNAVSHIYTNNTGVTANVAPSAPTGIVISTTWQSISVSWNASTDMEGSSPHYNLYVRNTTLGSITVTPMSNPSNGYRHVPRHGNTNHRTSWTITDLNPGHTYDICVQAVDAAWAGSPFTCVPGITLPTVGPNMMIADCGADVGAEQNNACGSVYWDSPAIYVRNQFDGNINMWHESPKSGQTNWVYVDLVNIGTGTLPAGVVTVYYAKASTGLGWQQSWVQNLTPLPYGDVVGSAVIGGVLSGGSVKVAIQWDNVPDPSDFGDPDMFHFCLLARFTAASDPITFPEITSVWDNTRNNNNIAWKNVSIIDMDGPTMIRGPIEIENTNQRTEVMKLEFATPEREMVDGFLDHGTITIDLGDELYKLWEAGGKKGEGIREVPCDTCDRKKIKIGAKNAYIENIEIEPGTRYTVGVEFQADYNKELIKNVYHWHIIQFFNGRDLPIGGETYYIDMPDRPAREGEGRGKSTLEREEIDAEYRLSARPNPTNSTTTIAYTLPDDDRVTLAIHDANGRLVRTLLAKSELKGGAHEIEWDGMTSAGAIAPSGTYFYRLITSDRTIERQLKVVR